MSNLSLRHLYKVYPNGVKAVNDFNMEIEDKEFIVFVGPSGCGKSTTLRMIAGLEDITAGELYIGDTFSNHVEPKDRDIAMVFQNYALYPHMTVYENLAFGLRLRHVPQAEIHKKVLWAAKILKLEEYLERKPKNLSGGQRQRVSLGRAILRTPKVFLLDEPLSNLDAKLRTEMRAEIAKLHQEIATTFIYVTHDQVEAMTMGTRIVVMSMGYVQQIDTPQNLYNYPDNKFVAGFIGTPQMNFFPATLKRDGNDVEIRFEGIDRTLHIPYKKLLKVRPEYFTGDKKIIVGLRCEQVSVDPEILKKSDCIMQVKISHFEELGNETLIYGDMNLSKNRLEDSSTRIIVKQYGGTHSSKAGDVIDVALDMEKAHFFDAETEKTIAPRIPVDNVFDVVIRNGIARILDRDVSLPAAVKEQLKDETQAVSILIPTDALNEGGEDLKAVVTNEEAINGVTITHFFSKGRTFFMIGSKRHEIGEELDLGVDFKRVTLYDKNQTELVKPLPLYDTFYGSYFDHANAARSAAHLVKYYEESKKKELDFVEEQFQAELAEVSFQPAYLKKLKASYEKKRQEIQSELSYRLGTEDLGKEGKKKAKAESTKRLEDAKKAYEAEVAAYEAKRAKFDRLSDTEKQKLAPKEASLRSAYEEKKRRIEAKYAELIRMTESGLDGACKLLLPIEAERAATAEKKMAQAKAAFSDAKRKRTEELNAAIERAKAEAATASGEDRDMKVILLKEAKRAKIDELAKLEAESNEELDNIAFLSKVFALYINGNPFLATEEINKKIVKGLGAQLFLSHYRFEVPHDAYILDDSGIEVTVDRMIDYGKDRFAKCKLLDDTVYVKTDWEFKSGDKLHISIEIAKSRIFENKFDIRLY